MSTADTVIGATINGTGSLRVNAVKVGADTVLAQIIRMVQQPRAHPRPGLGRRGADHRLPVRPWPGHPAVDHARYRQGARAGILIRSAEALETAHKLDTIIGTGTDVAIEAADITLISVPWLRSSPRSASPGPRCAASARICSLRWSMRCTRCLACAGAPSWPQPR